jgi:2-haloacid dehalogenase
MKRRTFVGMIAGSAALAACARNARPGVRAPTAIRAVAFDLFTIFDPRSIDAAVIAELPEEGAELARRWKLRAFEYCWLRAAGEHYVPFDQILVDALAQTLAASKLALSAPARARAVAAWTELTPWPDAAPALLAMRETGLSLAPLANFSPSMIEALLGHAKLRGLFDHVISTDAAGTYKPAARAYQLGVEIFGLPPAAIAFSAFGGWDAVGATWFGYPTCWVNRFGAADEELSAAPAHTAADLVALATWIASRR